MPIKRIKVTEIPRKRFHNSIVHELPEWVSFVKDSQKLGKGEGLRIDLDPAKLKTGLGLTKPVQAFAVAAKRHAKKHGLSLSIEVLKDPQTETRAIFITRKK